MTGDDFRELALAHQGVVEGAHMGHPDFRANGRIFATLQADERTGMVKVEPDEQALLLRDHPGVFTPAAGAWGRQGCTLVRLEAATPRVVRPAMLLAWQEVMAKPAARPRNTPARRSGVTKAKRARRR
jgi:hypothetical protein